VILDDPSFEDIVNATWSTDGQRIAFNSSQPGEAFPYHTWIMNADGTGIRRVFKDPLDRTDQNPIWSPDGRWIAVQRWYNPPEGVDVRPITIVDPDSGAFHEVGEVHMNGYDGWGWSPDGRSIIEVPGNLPGETQLANPVIIVDATTGKGIDSGWEARSNLAWQRQAP
jgi:Tol biopolymer transport system component